MKSKAFTITDVLAVIVVIFLLCCVLLPAFARTTTHSTLAQCEANMKQLAMAIQLYGRDNSDKLPSFGLGVGGSPWDVPATITQILRPYGANRSQFYDPGFPNQNIDQMWNYNVAYNSQGVPVSGYRETGYAFSFYASARVASDDWNVSFDTQSFSITGSDPQLTETIPAAAPGMIKVNPAKRVLLVDAIISGYNQTFSVPPQVYNWTYHTEVGNLAWQNTPFGPWAGASTPHLNSQLLPTGGNEGMLDGHVEWVPFGEMNVHTSPNFSADPFWWCTDPGKL